MGRGLARIPLAFLFLAAACTPGGRPPGRSFIVASCEPADLVPSNQSLDCEEQFAPALFTGLQAEEPETGRVINAVAQSVTSTDQITWIIKLHEGWTFHNGEPVTARSFVDAWNWTALQTNHAAHNPSFASIVGYASLNPGEGKEPTARTMSGVEILDRMTIQVKLIASGNLYLSSEEFAPLPQTFFRDPETWREMPIGDGPYQMDGPWKHHVAIKLKRYPAYGGTPAKADRIEFRIYEERDPFPDLERGLIDISAVAASDFQAARGEFRDHLLQRQSFLLNSIHFPLYDRRFRNQDLRQALSLAIDREAISEEVFDGTATPATSAFPSPVDGHRNDACPYCRLDVPLARQKLEASRWIGALNLMAPSDPVRLHAAQAIAGQWRRNLGLDVVLRPLKYSDLLDLGSRRAHTGPFWDSTTLDDSAGSWLGMYQTGNEELNWSGYSNPEVDRLIAAGDVASTPSEALSDYLKAEDIILEELPVIPLWYPELYIAYSNRLTGVMLLSEGEIALDQVSVVD